MRPGLLVIVFSSVFAGARHQASTLSALRRAGFHALACRSTADIAAQLLQHGAGGAGQAGATVLVDARSPQGLAAVGYVQVMFPGCRVLALVDPADRATLIAYLQNGIDAWVPYDAMPDLLAAAILNGARVRAGQAAGTCLPADAESCAVVSGPAQWAVTEQGWKLRSPDGHVVALTTSERSLIQCLMAAPGRRASHSDLVQAVSRRQPEGPLGPLDQSRLGVTISRLRRKAGRQGLELPLKSVHNWGYMFTGLP